ncbi:cytochrome P450 [Pseudomonas umsongensis]|uniref:cytochrome P450 n=1 Tax=Pseudomonas umsongensis TaxID=198618 RepID=UPI00200AE728|nr:cytochrome P450 [Pseudomonas umsongensis]MCK8683301.1 cytochrome P450 [Pseudomonas umsongensis]
MSSHTSFTEPAIQRCPFGLMAKLQQESPIYRDPVTNFLVLTRHADIVYVNQHPQLFSNTTSVILDRKGSTVADEVVRRYSDRGLLPMHTLVTNDPPSHTNYRALVETVFNASFVKQLESHIEALADELIDDFIAAGNVDLMVEFALKLPMYLISEQLGVSKEDWRRFKLWSDITVEQINPGLAPERELEITDHLIEMQHYLLERAEHYREHPAPTLLSRLANAEIDDRKLDSREFVAIAHQLLVAGNETTTSAIATGVLMLLEAPELRAKLQANPDRVTTFVEEVLRLHAPSPHLYRQVLQDCDIGGFPIAKDEVLMLSYLAANRDPEKFESPHCLDLERKNGRQHLAFGRGIHFCIGNQLARAELRIAFQRLLARLPHMSLDPNWPKPEFAAIYHVHTLEQLHVIF